jgi:hypothetical protein
MKKNRIHKKIKMDVVRMLVIIRKKKNSSLIS